MPRACAFLAALGCWAIVSAQPPPRDNPLKTTGTASIRGRVTDATGRPIALVEVRAAGGSRQPAIALTGADGGYDLVGLPAGTYLVTATKPNYVRSAWGEQRPEGPGKRITLADGETLSNINFRLARSGVIAGKIVDEFGDPVTDAPVSAMPYVYVQGSRRLMPRGRVSTNDIGEFRVYGLSPGQYYVSVTLREPATGNDDRSATRRPFIRAPAVSPTRSGCRLRRVRPSPAST